MALGKLATALIVLNTSRCCYGCSFSTEPVSLPCKKNHTQEISSGQVLGEAFLPRGTRRLPCFQEWEPWNWSSGTRNAKAGLRITGNNFIDSSGKCMFLVYLIIYLKCFNFKWFQILQKEAEGRNALDLVLVTTAFLIHSPVQSRFINNAHINVCWVNEWKHLTKNHLRIEWYWKETLITSLSTSKKNSPWKTRL